MRLTAVAVSLAATALAAGCGSGRAPYPAKVEKGFLRACNAGERRPQACRCILSRLEATVPYDEFRLADEALRAGNRAPAATEKKVAAATNACA